jgi:hypothetical protein
VAAPCGVRAGHGSISKVGQRERLARRNHAGPVGDEGFKFGGWFDQMPDDVRAERAKVECQEALDAAAWLAGRGTYRWFAGR